MLSYNKLIYDKWTVDTMPYCLKCGETTEHKIPDGDNNKRQVCPCCGYIHYENPKVICGALVTYQDKVLLCRRAIEPRYGYWTLPAGFMEIGESLVEGAMRETFEEAQAIGENPKLYCIYDIPDIGQVYILYLAQLKVGKFGAGVESLECALFSEQQIPWNELAFTAVEKTLQHYFYDRQHNFLVNFPIHQEVIYKD